MLTEIKSERLVEYIKTEIDNNNILYIHMELCSDNLENILKSKHLVFKRAKNDKMTELEYYISCKIFIELLEALRYLHQLSPPIIHRDIKPANILFDERGRKNEIFFKICDFGLSKIDNSSNTIGVGTHKYMAPEISYGNYTTEVDIFSLSIVGQQLYDLGNNLSRSDELKRYFESIVELIEEMRKVNYKTRPSCMEILNNQNKWCLPSIPLTDFSANDSFDCQSLNIYIKHHLDSVVSDIAVEHKDIETLPRYMRYENNLDKFLICDKIPEDIRKIVKYFLCFQNLF